MPAAGDLSIVLDGAGNPLCIIETTEIRIVPFGQVDPQFAYDDCDGAIIQEPGDRRIRVSTSRLVAACSALCNEAP